MQSSDINSRGRWQYCIYTNVLYCLWKGETESAQSSLPGHHEMLILHLPCVTYSHSFQTATLVWSESVPLNSRLFSVSNSHCLHACLRVDPSLLSPASYNSCPSSILVSPRGLFQSTHESHSLSLSPIAVSRLFPSSFLGFSLMPHLRDLYISSFYSFSNVCCTDRENRLIILFSSWFVKACGVSRQN